jgi:hypothetical protein
MKANNGYIELGIKKYEKQLRCRRSVLSIGMCGRRLWVSGGKLWKSRTEKQGESAVYDVSSWQVGLETGGTNLESVMVT